jgi:hypothetical protein
MRLVVIAGPAYWASRAEMKRRAWEGDPDTAVVRELRRRTQERGSAKRVAHELGISYSALRAAVNGRSRPPRLLRQRLHANGEG